MIKYLYFIDDPQNHKFDFPTDFNNLMNLFETSEYFAIDKMRIDLLQEILEKEEFLKFTNVRRHYIDNIAED